MPGMQTERQSWTQNRGNAKPTAGKQAVVIGSSIAGLIAAQLLLPYFDQVTITDRDQLPETAEFRRGTPQARHPHTLLKRGQLILEQRFPGLTDELLAHGALSIDAERELAYFREGGWRTPGQHEDTLAIACSRPLLENIIYRRVIAHPKVRSLPGHEAVCLSVDAYQGRARQGRVTGIQMRTRQRLSPSAIWLPANLIIDASGRQSRAPEWLAKMGYTPPVESTIDAKMGYATRIYRRPAAHANPWQAMYVQPEAPDQPAGGMIMPMEGDRWHVTLIGMGGHYPPTDEAGFMEYARRLPTSGFYEAIAGAEPLTKPIGYRRTESRFRAYDRLPRYLEGFLVYGDAVMAINPLYAQGMTAVALGSQALEQALQAHATQLSRGNVAGLAATFQKELAEVLYTPWETAWRNDIPWRNA